MKLLSNLCLYLINCRISNRWFVKKRLFLKFILPNTFNIFSCYYVVRFFATFWSYVVMSYMDDLLERKAPRYSIYLFIYSSLSCQNTRKTVFLEEVHFGFERRSRWRKLCAQVSHNEISFQLYQKCILKIGEIKKLDTGMTIWWNKLNWNFDARRTRKK